MAMQMQQLARGFLAFDLTGVAVAVGIVAIGSGIPMLLASFGGLVVDRVPKRQLMIVTESIMVITTVAIGVLIAADAIAIWHLAILSFVQGATLALNLPSRISYITNLVNREQLPNAIALMNSGSNLTRVLGPSLAGLLIAVPFISFAGTFFLMASLHALVVVLVMKINDPGLPEPRHSSDSAFQEMTAGLRFIWTSPVLRTLIFLAFVPIILGMPYNFLLPVFAGDVYDVGSAGLGWMMATAGLGGLIGSLGIAYFSSMRRRWLMQLGLGIAFGVGLMAFGLNTSYLVALLLLVFIGIVSQAFMTTNHMMIMLATPQRLFGRVMALYMTTFGLIPIALLPITAVSDIIGVGPTLAIVGAVIAAVVALILLFKRSESELQTPST